MTFGEIKRAMVNYRNPRTYKPFRNLFNIKKLDVIPFKGTKKVTYKATIVGESDTYVCSIQFLGINFEDAPTQSATEDAQDSKGQAVFFEKPFAERTPVKLKCSCTDFRFRTEKPLHDKKSLIGNWRKYIRKTPPPPLGRPFVNPDNIPNFCKHVNSLMKSLKIQGKVR